MLSIRKRENMSQQQFSKFLGVSTSLIAQYETGDRNPSMPMLRKIAEMTNTELVIEFREKKGTPKQLNLNLSEKEEKETEA